MTVLDRFLKYVKIETTSCEENECCPSTPGQKKLGALLAEELREMGIADAEMDADGYVYATILPKGTTDKPAIGLIAHMDTSDAVKGPTDPQMILNFDGNAIMLKNGTVIDGFEFLKTLEGKDLVVTDGNSVLGADDKAGIAEIMTLCERMCRADAPNHGKICIAFTPDEEIGRGADRFNVKRFGADFAYTVDGDELGELEYECFNAASCRIIVKGISIHPGSAKNQMKNAALIAMEFAGMLPPSERPEHTEKYEGFYHLTGMHGNEEMAELKYILRDHDTDKFNEKKETVKRISSYLNEKYGAGTVEILLQDSYRNMKEIVEKHPEILERAEKAFRNCGVDPIIKPIRGGTDGARLSFMGLPCPNLSTGGYNYHSRKELIPVQSMEKMTDVLEKLILM